MQVLVNFDSKLELVLACDASIDLRMVLSHSMHAWWWTEKPIVFAFHTLSCTERHYLQVEKRSPCYRIWSETLLLVHIYGWHFYLQTDQKSVSTLLSESRSFSEDYMRWALNMFRCMGMLLRWTGCHFPVEWVLLIEGLKDSPNLSAQIHTWTRRDSYYPRCMLQCVQQEWLTVMWWLRNWSHTGIEVGAVSVWWMSPVGVQSGISPGRNQALRELHGGHPGCLRMKSLTRMFCWRQEWMPRLKL